MFTKQKQNTNAVRTVTNDRIDFKLENLDKTKNFENIYKVLIRNCEKIIKAVHGIYF